MFLCFSKTKWWNPVKVGPKTPLRRVFILSSYCIPNLFKKGSIS